MPEAFPIGIVRCATPTEEERVTAKVRELLDWIGGVSEIVNPSDVVLLKPNLVAPLHYTTGAVTNPFVLKGLVEALKTAGARKIVIGDSSFLGEDTEKAIALNGYREILESTRVKVVDFKKEEYITVPVTGSILHRVKLPASFMEADVVINVPAPKTHDALPVSLGLKNMKGLLRDTDKRRMHKIGLEQAIVDLNRVVMPDLVVYDGIIGQEGHGPIHGRPKGLGVLVASRNILGAELITAQLMGFDLKELGYLQYASQAGLGKLDGLKVVGDEPVDQAKSCFARYEPPEKTLGEKNILVHAGTACSACRAAFDSMVLGEPELLNLLEGYRVYMGEPPQSVPMGEKVLLIGSCVRGMKEHGLYVPGCPPPLVAIINTLKRGKTLSMV